MNYIDLLLLAILIIAMYAGWKKGFILGTINLAVWIGSLVAGFLFYNQVGKFFDWAFPSIGVWNLPVAFLTTIILARTLLALLFNFILKRTPEELHINTANRALGILPGAINGLIYATVVAAILLTVPLRNQLSSTTRKSPLAQTLGANIGWIEDRFSPIFGEALRKTITGATVHPKSDETVQLNFTVDDAAPRPDLEAEMLELVNEERAKAGLRPLRMDMELTPVARAHSSDMFVRGYFSHYTPEKKDPFDRMKLAGIRYSTAGENLALGQTLRICHDGLMNSPGHRANILNPAYGRVGIGILDGGAYGLMISQEFRN